MTDENGDRSRDTGPGRDPFARLPRCGARTRAGTPCRRPGNRRNGRCHLHGGWAGGPRGEANGNYRHGLETREARAQRRVLRALLREARATLGRRP